METAGPLARTLPADLASIRLSYLHEHPWNGDPTAAEVWDVSADAYLEGDADPWHVGDIEIVIVDTIHNYNPLSALQDLDIDLGPVPDLLFNPVTGRLAADLDEQWEPRNSRVMILNWVELEPEWQGCGLGLALAGAAIKRLSPEVRTVVSYPRLGFDTSIDEESRLYAEAGLQLLWNKLGFEHVRDELYALDLITLDRALATLTKRYKDGVGPHAPAGAGQEGQRSGRNKCTVGCARCSVLVSAGGGFLRSGDSGSEVWCQTCHDIDSPTESEDFDEEGPVLPSTPPLGCGTSLLLHVLALTLKCWKCGHDTVCVAGLYPAHPSRTYVGIHAIGDERTMALAKRLLQQSGRPDLARLIQSRYSKTMGEQSLANCCQHCGSLQGNFFVNEEALSRVAADGRDGLDIVAIADCPALDWQERVHNSESTICI